MADGPSTPACRSGDAGGHAVAVGVIIMAVGLALLAERQLHLEGQLIGRLWPLAPMALGVARLLPRDDTRRGRSRRRSGAWLIFVGVWGLVSEFRVLGLTFQTSWPLLVIGAGLLVVWGALTEPAHARES